MIRYDIHCYHHMYYQNQLSINSLTCIIRLIELWVVHHFPVPVKKYTHCIRLHLHRTKLHHLTLDTAMGAGGQHSYCMACPAILQAPTSQLCVNVWMVLVVLRSHNQPPAGALNWTLFCLLQFPGLIWQSVWGKPQVTVANYTSGNTWF